MYVHLSLEHACAVIPAEIGLSAGIFTDIICSLGKPRSATFS